MPDSTYPFFIASKTQGKTPAISPILSRISPLFCSGKFTGTDSGLRICRAFASAAGRDRFVPTLPTRERGRGWWTCHACHAVTGGAHHPRGRAGPDPGPPILLIFHTCQTGANPAAFQWKLGFIWERLPNQHLRFLGPVFDLETENVELLIWLIWGLYYHPHGKMPPNSTILSI